MHPEKNTVVIDYGLATVMLPTVLTGSLIGVFLNVMLPPLILQIILTIILLGLTIHAIVKSIQIFRAETVSLTKQKEAQNLLKEREQQRR